jgi:hypothetical protein
MDRVVLQQLRQLLQIKLLLLLKNQQLLLSKRRWHNG